MLHCPYTWEKARLVLREMTDLLVLDLVEKGLVTDQMVLTIGYDIENLTDPTRSGAYRGIVDTDHYGRKVPKSAHGSVTLERQTSSTQEIMDAVLDLYDSIVNPILLVRRINVTAGRIEDETKAQQKECCEQLSLFMMDMAQTQESEQKQQQAQKEKKLQHVMLDIKKKYGIYAILKGMNLEEGAMTIQRNNQIGGHKA